MKIRYFLIGLIIIFLLFIALIWIFSYEEITYQILHFYGKKERLIVFRTSYLTLSKFTFLRYLSVFLLIIFSISISYLENKIRESKVFFIRCFEFLKEKKKESIYVIQHLSKEEKYLFWIGFIVTILLKIYFWTELPLFVDEAFSFLFFVDKGFLVTSTYYPGPNNHILYNLLANFCALIFENGMLIMRLPSFLISISLYFIVFILLKKVTSTYISLLSIWVLNSYFLYNYYTVSGRGYVLYLACFIFVLYSFYQFNNTKKQYYIFIYGVFSVFGLYTIPTFVYPVISCFVIGIFIFKEKIHWIRAHVFMGIITIVFYSPVFLISGIGAITNNSWVKPLSFSVFLNEYFTYLIEVFDSLVEFQKFSILVFLIIFIVLFYVKKDKKAIVYSVLFFVIPLLILLFQQVLPFSRIWIYLLIIQSIWIALLFNHFFKKKEMMYAFLILLMLFSGYKWQKEFKNGFGVYDEIPTVTNLLLTNNAELVYIEEDTYNILTHYAFQQKKKSITVDVNFFDKEKKYDFILLMKNSDKSIDENYHLVYKNKSIHLYQKQ